MPVDAVAVASGPGLAPCLSVGVAAAARLALAWGVPLLGVNHVEAHALVAQLAPELAAPTAAAAVATAMAANDSSSSSTAAGQNSSSALAASAAAVARSLPPRPLSPLTATPALALVASGGHSQLVWAAAPGRHRVLATTLDDAAGEALDKACRVGGLARLNFAAIAAVVEAEEALRARQAADVGVGEASAECFPLKYLPKELHPTPNSNNNNNSNNNSSDGDSCGPTPAAVWAAFTAHLRQSQPASRAAPPPASLLWPHLSDARLPASFPAAAPLPSAPASPFTVYPRDLGALEATREQRHWHRRRALTRFGADASAPQLPTPDTSTASSAAEAAETVAAAVDAEASPWALQPGAGASAVRAWLEWRNLQLVQRLQALPQLPPPRAAGDNGNAADAGFDYEDDYSTESHDASADTGVAATAAPVTESATAKPAVLPPGAILERAAHWHTRVAALLAGCVTAPQQNPDGSTVAEGSTDAAAADVDFFGPAAWRGVLTPVASPLAAVSQSPEAAPLPTLAATSDRGQTSDREQRDSESDWPLFQQWRLPVAAALPLPPRPRVPLSPLLPLVDIPLPLPGSGSGAGLGTFLIFTVGTNLIIRHIESNRHFMLN